MKLSAQIIGTVKFVLMMIIFSFVVFAGYSLEKKITGNIRDGKASQRTTYLPMNLHKPPYNAHYRM